MSADRLARATRKHSRRQAQVAKDTVQLAECVSTDPLEFSLTDADIDLLEGEYFMTQWVRKYHADNEIDLEDLVLVVKKGGRWIITDVLSDKAV